MAIKILKSIIFSLLITFALIFVIYTLWFFWMQLYELPAGYPWNYDGKGAARCTSKVYCMGFGTKCCTFGDVIIQYFSVGILWFIYYFKIFLIPFFFIVSFSVFFLNIPKLIKDEKSK